MIDIAIDLRVANGKPAGMARYALELAERIPPLAPDLSFLFITGPGAPPLARANNVSIARTRSPFLSPLEQIELPLATRHARLLHATTFSVPFLRRQRLIATLHDANHLAFPEYYGRAQALYFQWIVGPVARRARILTVSHFAKQELVTRLGVSADHITVTPLAASSDFRPHDAATLEAFRARRGLPKRFVLYVGNDKPHKNVATLIQAHRRLPDDIGLVLCGVEPLAAPTRAIVWRDAPKEELPLLYGAASVFCFPSRYEGFGLPPLESLACGTPVAAARAASIPEVLGDAATYFDPDDVEGCANAIRRLLALLSSERETLRVAGMEHARHFSWEKTARRTLAAYRAALADVSQCTTS